MKRLVTTTLLLVACGTHDASEPQRVSREAIVGGSADTTDKAVVYVVVTQGNTTSVCTGVMLGSNLVLTSRTCAAQAPTTADCGASVFGAPFDASTITVIDDDAYTGGAPQVAANVSQIIVPGDEHLCGANLALLVLGKPLAPTPIVPRLDAPPAKDEAFTVVGYGATEVSSGGGSGTRRSIAGKVVCADATCAGGALDGAKEFAASGGPCAGDGGGPALASDGRVFGIVARGSQDCTTDTVYQRLDAWASFLRTGAKTAAAAGGYAAPAWAGTADDGGVEAGSPVPDAGTDAASASGGSTSGGGGGCGVTRERTHDGAAIAIALSALVVRRRRARLSGRAA